MIVSEAASSNYYASCHIVPYAKKTLINELFCGGFIKKNVYVRTLKLFLSLLAKKAMFV